MPQEDRIYSTGREAIESLRDDYRDFNDDPDESFEEFAGDVLDIFNAAPDAVFSYDPQIRPGSIQRLPEPSREELLGLCSLASTQLMGRARNCANPHDMVRYALAAEWIENDNAELVPFLTQEERNRITIELAKNNRAAASGVLEDSALENVAHAHGPVDGPSTERPEVFCTIQWAGEGRHRAGHRGRYRPVIRCGTRPTRLARRTGGSPHRSGHRRDREPSTGLFHRERMGNDRLRHPE